MCGVRSSSIVLNLPKDPVSDNIEAAGTCRSMSDEPHRISPVTLDPEDKADLCLLGRRTEIGWFRVEGYHCACLTFLCPTTDVFVRLSLNALWESAN